MTTQHEDEYSDLKDEPYYMIMIDAALTHTQVFLVEFLEGRKLVTTEQVMDAINGKRLTYPNPASMDTSGHFSPGIGTWAYIDNEYDLKTVIIPYLTQMIDFAKDSLADRVDDWGNFPLFFGWTGAGREAIRPYALRICDVVRNLLMEESFNPFHFEPNYAIVISAEEQGAFQWATLNYLLGTLGAGNLGDGVVPEETVGLLRMSGASTEIVFSEPKNDIMDSHYKFQLGPKQRWDLYSKSFIYSGVNSAWDRFNARLAVEADNNNTYLINNSIPLYNPCLAGGSHKNWTSLIQAYSNFSDGSFIPIANPNNLWDLETDYTQYMLFNPNESGDYSACAQKTVYLLLKDINAQWCDFAHDRDCSWVGAYQPPLPVEKGKFYGTDWIFDTVNFMGLAPVASLDAIKEQTKVICNMSLVELMEYNNNLPIPYEQKEYHMYCFIACWFHTLLTEGYGFEGNYNLTVYGSQADKGASPAEWTLGGAMFHVNTLPWIVELETTTNGNANLTTLSSDDDDDSSMSTASLIYIFVAVFVLLAAAIAGGAYVMEYRREKKEREAAAAASEEPVESDGLVPAVTYGTSGEQA